MSHHSREFSHLRLPSYEEVLALRSQLEVSIAQFNLPAEHAVIIGGAVLQLHGVRQAHDFDVMASPDLLETVSQDRNYQLLKPDYTMLAPSYGRWIWGIPRIPFHPRDIGGNVRSKQLTILPEFTDEVYPIGFEDALEHSEEHMGMRFITLAKLYEWKLAMADRLWDIGLPDKFIERRDCALIEMASDKITEVN